MTSQRTQALEEFDVAILRAVAGRFVIVMDKKTLCEWCAAFPNFDVFVDQLKESSNLALQFARGRARSAKGDFLILDGGKTNAQRRGNQKTG